MAMTVSLVSFRHESDRKIVVADVTFDNSYPTGGLAVPNTATTGLMLEHGITSVQVPALNVAGTRLFAYDHTNTKIKVFTALSTEAANASDQSTITVRVVATGKGGAVV